MSSRVFASRWGKAVHFERVVIRNNKGQIVKVVIKRTKMSKYDIADALDFVD